VTAMSDAADAAAPGLRIAPLASFGTRRARRLVERNILVYRRGWMYFVSGFFEPFFYLLSIGVGFAKLVPTVHIGSLVVPFTQFVAPGLLASSAMNGATLDSTFNIFFKLKIAKTYDAVLSTPLSPGDIALGEMTWCLMRATTYSIAFLAVMAGLGDVVSAWALLCLPGAMLLSFAFAGIGMAGTTYMRSWQDFDKVSLTLIPLFLFSGIFFPLTTFPGWLQAVVRCTPLYQGVALLRGLDLGLLSWTLVGHAAYLAVAGLVGLTIATRRMASLLLP
jgi:lipooligosaccharide transport system permease protein